MTEFFTNLISGLSIGGVYALIALGYTMVYGIAKMLNFAHGDIIMVGGYAIYVLFKGLGVNPVLSVLLACVVCAAAGVLIERFAYRPLRGASPLAVLITAIGVSYLLQSISQIVFGEKSKQLTLFHFEKIEAGPLVFKAETIITLVAALVIMAALYLFINRTRTGKAMMAVSEDRGAAELMGINVNLTIMITFAIGSALAAVASAAYILIPVNVSNTMGAMPGIKAFTAAVIGGIGSIPGAMLGGLLLGVVETFCNATSLASFTVAIEFSILIAILLVRPNGLLGKRKREKV